MAGDYTRRFTFADYKELSKDIQRIGEMGDEISSHLATYIKNEQPRFSYEGNRGTIIARMDHLEDDGVWLDIGGVLTKMKLSNPAIRHGNLIEKVAKYASLSQDHIAAYAWIWRIEDAKEFSTQKYQKAIINFGTSGANANSKKPAKEQPVENLDALFFKQKVMFAEVGPGAASWFNGTGVTIEDDGLVWFSDKNVNVSLLKESIIPTLELKEGLKPPFQIRLRVKVADDSILLVGLREGTKGVRLGLDTRTGRIGGVITGPRESIISQPLPSRSEAVAQTMDLMIGMGPRGVVGFRINGKRYVADRESFRLPNKDELKLVFQALNTNNSESEIVVESLEIVKQ